MFEKPIFGAGRYMMTYAMYQFEIDKVSSYVSGLTLIERVHK